MKINNLKDKLITCGIFIICLILFRVFHIPCPMDFLFHIRAYICLLHLDIPGAFQTHPMFWSVPILLIFYFADGSVFKQKWLNWGILILISAGYAVNWIAKLLI